MRKKFDMLLYTILFSFCFIMCNTEVSKADTIILPKNNFCSDHLSECETYHSARKFIVTVIVVTVYIVRKN